MSSKSLRNLSRLIHVLAGLGYPLLIYSPLGQNNSFLAFNRVMLLPAVTLTGLLMWQQPKIMKWFKRRG